jgi:hypothetical protein
MDKMTKDDLIKKLIALAQDWDKRAWEEVPVDYSSRNLHYKYMKLDNEAAGLSTCAEELKELIDEAKFEYQFEGFGAG